MVEQFKTWVSKIENTPFDEIWPKYDAGTVVLTAQIFLDMNDISTEDPDSQGLLDFTMESLLDNKVDR
jgi:hypothetical protein